MNLKEIEYILKIAEEKNITHAAEKLFITQSALNQQLLKLEKELAVLFFTGHGPTGVRHLPVESILRRQDRS